jgi:hypothetical protein
MNDKTVKYLLSASISIFIVALVGAITSFSWDSSNSNNNDNCSMIEATDPDMKGWLVEICNDGVDGTTPQQTWISPEGKRCVANEALSGPTNICSSPSQ